MSERPSGIVDAQGFLADDKIDKLLQFGSFDGAMFMALETADKEAVSKRMVKRGLITQEEAAQLSFAIEDRSYGVNLPEKIIRAMRFRLGRIMEEAISTELEDRQEVVEEPRDKEEVQPEIEFDEKKWNRFISSMEGASVATYSWILSHFILSEPNPYIWPAWELLQEKGDDFRVVTARVMISSTVVPDQMKEKIWDSVKDDMASFSRPEQERLVDDVFYSGNVRIQEECFSRYKQYVDHGNVVSRVGDSIRRIIISDFLDLHEGNNDKRYKYNDERLVMILRNEAVVPLIDDFRPRLVEILDKIGAKAVKERPYLMTIASIVKHWSFIEEILEEDGLWKYAFLAKLFLDKSCPEKTKVCIARKAADGLHGQSVIFFDDVDKAGLAMVGCLPQADADKLADRFYESLFSKNRSFGGVELHDFNAYNGNDNYSKRLRYIRFLLDLIDLVHEVEVKEKIARGILAASPRNEVLHELEQKVPHLRDEIVKKADGVDEAVMRLFQR